MKNDNTYFDLNRRQFLKTSAIGALVLGTYFVGSAPKAFAGVLEQPSEQNVLTYL